MNKPSKIVAISLGIVFLFVISTASTVVSSGGDLHAGKTNDSLTETSTVGKRPLGVKVDAASGSTGDPAYLQEGATILQEGANPSATFSQLVENFTLEASPDRTGYELNAITSTGDWIQIMAADDWYDGLLSGCTYSFGFLYEIWNNAGNSVAAPVCVSSGGMSAGDSIQLQLDYCSSTQVCATFNDFDTGYSNAVILAEPNTGATYFLNGESCFASGCFFTGPMTETANVLSASCQNYTLPAVSYVISGNNLMVTSADIWIDEFDTDGTSCYYVSQYTTTLATPVTQYLEGYAGPSYQVHSIATQNYTAVVGSYSGGWRFQTDVNPLYLYVFGPPGGYEGNVVTFYNYTFGGVAAYPYFYEWFDNGSFLFYSETNWNVTLTGTGNQTFTIYVYDNLDDVAAAYVNITVLPPPSYNVTFTQSGLLVGDTWYVNITAGPSLSGTGTTLETALENGTYSYSLATNDKRYQPIYAPSFVTVGGTSVSVSFSTLTYAVTFKETGLPAGTFWSTAIGGVTHSSIVSTITFQETNGSYAYRIGLLTGYHAIDSGKISVIGLSVLTPVSFSKTTYAVDFTESGLTSGTSWCVAFHGTKACSTGTPIAFTGIPNGTFSYTITKVKGYALDGAYSGTVAVAGRGQGTTSDTVKVAWTLVKYAVTFTETALAKGTSWSVTIDSQTKMSKGTSISFTMPNATYAFTIAASGYTEKSSPSSPLIVNGAAKNVAVTFKIT